MIKRRTFTATSIYKFSTEFGKMIFNEIIDIDTVRKVEGENAEAIIAELKNGSHRSTYEERKVYSKKSPNSFYIRKDMLTMLDADLVRKTFRLKKEVKKEINVNIKPSKSIEVKKEVAKPKRAYHIPKTWEFKELGQKGQSEEKLETLEFLGCPAAAVYFNIQESVLYKNKKRVIEINGKKYAVKKYISKK